MRKDLSQIIGEATERLPKQEQVIDDYWSIMIDERNWWCGNRNFYEVLLWMESLFD